MSRRAATPEELLAQARTESAVFLPRVEPLWIGAVVGLAGVALGIGLQAHGAAAGDPRAWIALALVVIGMALHLTLKRADGGWRVDFEHRRVEPVGVDGAGLTLDGDGYAIVCTAGTRRASIAIDLTHDERGKLARLFQTPGPVSRRAHVAYSELCDVLARRLRVARHGITI